MAEAPNSESSSNDLRQAQPDGASLVQDATDNAIDKALTLLDPEERGMLQMWRNNKSEMTIVTLGETGVGKSTLLNGLFGVKEFKEGDTLDPGTTRVITHKYIRIGVILTVHDCPGLLDGTGNEGTYLDDMKAKTSKGIDLMLYCISMKESRAHLTDDPTDKTKKSAVTIVTETLGQDVWKNTMFVLTYANVFSKDLKTTLGANWENSLDQTFEDRIAEWKTKIQQALVKNGVDPSVAENIIVQPAGYYKKRSLPRRNYWLSGLWGHALLRISNEARINFLQMAGHRLKLSSNTSEDDFKKSIEEQPIVITPSMDVLIMNMPATMGSHKTMPHGQSSANEGAMSKSAQSSAISTKYFHQHKGRMQKILYTLWIKVKEWLHREQKKPLLDLRNKLHGETWL